VGLLVLVTAGLIGLAAMQARTERIVDRELAPALPVPVEAGAGVGETAVELSGAGRVVLDLQGAGFNVRPAAPDEGLRISASFDEKSYELTESFEPDTGDGWEYRLEFRQTGLVTGLKELLGGTPPEVSIALPVDQPIGLDLSLRQGAVEMDAGGLWLTRANFRLKQGALDLDVSRPLHAPMEALSFRISMGGANLESLGNASPAALDIDLSMGGADIDLRGNWVQDARISFDTGMGGGQVRLPRNVRIEGLDRGVFEIRPEEEVTPPTLYFEIAPEDLENLEFIE
jgi:hypothetical protein